MDELGCSRATAVPRRRVPARCARRADRERRGRRGRVPLRRQRGRTLRAAGSVAHQRGTAGAARAERTARRAPVPACWPARWRRSASRIERLLSDHASGRTLPIERIRVIASGARKLDEATFRTVASAVLNRQAPEVPLSRALDRRGDRAHGVAAAAHPLSRQLVPRRLGPQPRSAAQLRAGSHSRARRCSTTARSIAHDDELDAASRLELRHLLRRAEGLGDDPFLAACGALGRRRALALAAAGRVPGRWPLRTETAVSAIRASC